MNVTPGPKILGTSWIVWLFMMAWTIAQIGSAGMVGAIAGVIHGLMPLSEWFSAGGDEVATTRSVQCYSIAVFVTALLLMWRAVYSKYEKIVIILVIGFSFTVLIGLVMLQGTDFAITGNDISLGLLFSLGDDASGAGFAVIVLIGGLGVSGIELLVYPYWIREKGYSRFLGSPDSPEWIDRTRGWIQILKIDAAAATLLATVLTSAYFLLGAAVLHQQGIKPEGIGVVEQISAIFTGTYGSWSRGLFLLGALCTLYSTLLHATSANGRIYTDFFASLGFVARDNPRALNVSHRIMQFVFLSAVLVIFLLMPERPEILVLLSHWLIGMVGTPIAIMVILFLAFKTDRRVRMNLITAGLFVASVLVILTCVGIGFAFQSKWIGQTNEEARAEIRLVEDPNRLP